MINSYIVTELSRALLTRFPHREHKSATKIDYAGKVKRFVARVGDKQSYDTLIQEALNTNKAAAWQANRAALIYCVTTKIRQGIADHDRLEQELEALNTAGEANDQRALQKLVSSLHGWNTTLQAVIAAKLPIEGREKRHSKREDMKGLPEDWRERIIARMPKYASQALVCAVTGCRPEELKNGIDVGIGKNGRLVIRIWGAKETEESGQAWRRLYWPADSTSLLVRSLFDLASQQRVGRRVRIAVDSAKAFSGAMRQAGIREWPKRQSTVTPICMRHQAAADMKIAGLLSSSEISAALGHVSDVTKTTYGHANMGRKSGGTSPYKVEAARPVHDKAPSKAAARRAAENDHQANSEMDNGPKDIDVDAPK